MLSTYLILIFEIILLSNLCPVKGEIQTDLFLPSEATALIKFRERLVDVPRRDIQNTDDSLIRWLQANDMNVESAVKMFKENLKWRAKNKIDGILNETIFDFNPSPVLIEGFDKEGYPLMFFAPSHIDGRRLVIQGQRDKIIRYWFQILEKCANIARSAPKLANGHNVTKTTVVLDMYGYNLRQHVCLDCITIYREWFIGVRKYYPEGLRHLVVINVPRTAKQMIEIIRPLLSTSSLKALKIFGTDRKEYSSFLLKYIDQDQLPYRLGGTKKTAMRLG